MNALYDWVRNITYYLIFITVVSNLLPNKKYEKYLKLFAGMVLILLVVKPLTGSLRLEDKIAYYFESISFQKEANQLKEELLGMEDERLERMIAQYQEAVAVDIKTMAEGSGFYAREAAVTIDQNQGSETFGRVTDIFLRLSRERGEEAQGAPGGITPVEPVRVEPVNAETQTQPSPRSQEENAELAGLRRRISEYYELEGGRIEIQLEDE